MDEMLKECEQKQKKMMMKIMMMKMKMNNRKWRRAVSCRFWKESFRDVSGGCSR